MNLPGLLFALIAYSVLKFMIIGDIGGQPQPEVPILNQDFCPLVDCGFIEPECGNPVFLCIDYLGDVLFNVAVVVIQVFTFIVNLTVFIFQLIVFLGTVSIETIPDAPWYVNIILLTPFTFLLALIIFKLIAKGDDE